MTSDTAVGVTLAIAALIMFATNILVTKAASTKVDVSVGFLVSVIVNCLVSGIALVVQQFLRTSDIRWSIGGAISFILAGIFSTYLGRWFFYESVVRLGSARASVFQVTSPAFAAVIAWIFLSEKLALIGIVGIALTIFGLITVASSPREAMSWHGGTLSIRKLIANSLSWAKGSHIALGLGSSMAYAVSTVLRGNGIREWNEPIVGALLGAMAGLLVYLVTSRKAGSLFSGIRKASHEGLWLYAASGLLTIIAQICAISSFRFIPVSLSNLITLCTPFIVIPCGYFLHKNNERITVRTWIGAGFVFLGIALMIYTKE
jgi:drug/metabolite transporter (DMT)-like permease